MANKVLLVEGVDDLHVVLNIQGYLGFRVLNMDKDGIKDEHEIQIAEGIRNLLKELRLHIMAAKPDYKVGVILDADTNLTGRWEAVSNILKPLGYKVPSGPDLKGTILQPPEMMLPRVGIWLMPNNKENGVLEDFLQSLVDPHDELLSHARGVVEKLPKKEFSDVAKAKAVMHTWLAWQKEPGKPFGQAIKAVYLDAHRPTAQDLADWLKNLYS